MFFPEIGAGKVGRLTLGMFLARKKRSRNCETLINVDTYSLLVMKKAGLTFYAKLYSFFVLHRVDSP
jgi:hypothetical protein